MGILMKYACAAILFLCLSLTAVFAAAETVGSLQQKALAGDQDAADWLGHYYEDAHDADSAAKWYAIAVDNGSTAALRSLGNICYNKGRNVEAYVYFTASYKRTSNPDTFKMLQQTKRRMSPEQIEDAESMAQAFLDSH